MKTSCPWSIRSKLIGSFPVTALHCSSCSQICSMGVPQRCTQSYAPHVIHGLCRLSRWNQWFHCFWYLNVQAGQKFDVSCVLHVQMSGSSLRGIWHFSRSLLRSTVNTWVWSATLPRMPLYGCLVFLVHALGIPPYNLSADMLQTTLCAQNCKRGTWGWLRCPRSSRKPTTPCTLAPTKMVGPISSL